MKEFIGTCIKCNKEIYCKDGFLDGVNEQGRLYCFTCSVERQREAENKIN
ncbi:hypothetical protein [Oceanobacillus jeddahense]|nr:hypothetical protein [Oceanobacillus jeddahense]